MSNHQDPSLLVGLQKYPVRVYYPKPINLFFDVVLVCTSITLYAKATLCVSS